ncbi:hypothetical protein [Wenzhouxiangella sp. EGI_FJ10409]|uniref:hypothetical protein n=1 Tax=Wenzhouxiangella sp. EGI_FJ10409 TaxID=3243767 RepID=UPI0035E1ECC5
MKESSRHQLIWRWSNWGFATAGFFSTLVGFSLQFPVDDETVALIRIPVAFLEAHAPVILLLAAAVALFAQLFRGRFGNPWAWETVETLLGELREHLIADKYLREPLHHHRVTLFRHQKFKLDPGIRRLWRKGEPWRWPWKGWLVQVARSGHTTQNTKRTFCAPDYAELAEGVAGQTWVRLTTFEVRDIDPPTLDDPDSISNYAQETYVSEEYVKAKLRATETFPRSMIGFPIEKGGKPWGVIVVDSIHGDGIESYGDFDKASVIAQTAISQLTSEL